MRCDEVREHLSAYLDEELSAELTAAVRAHLQSCAECRRLSEGLRATVDLLGRLPAHAAPEGLAADVQREIERRALVATPAVESPPQERMLPIHRVRQWPRMLAVAATLLLAAGIGVLAYMGRPGLPSMQLPMPEPESAPAILPSTAPSASAPLTTTPPAFAPGAKEKHDSYAVAPSEAPTAPAPAPAVAQNVRSPAPASTSAALARVENGKDRRSGGAAKAPATKKEPAPEAPAAVDKLAATGANAKALVRDLESLEATPMKRAAEDKTSLLASVAPAKPQPGKMSATNGAETEARAGRGAIGLDIGATAVTPSGAVSDRKKPEKAAIDDTVKFTDASAVAPTQLTMTLGDTSRALGARTDADGDGLRRPDKAGASYFGTMDSRGRQTAGTDETQLGRAKAAPAPTDGGTLAANGGTLTNNKVTAAPAPAAAPAMPSDVVMERPVNTLESVHKAVDGAARGNLTTRDLGRAVTREQLLKAPDQLVIRADSLEAADKALVRLFHANGWRPVAAGRGGVERLSEGKKSVAANGTVVGSGGAVTDPGIGAGFAMAQKPAEELPAPTGVYFLAESNGEETWVVLTDRDTLSRFSSQLAAAEGMTVAMESSDEFRAVGRLQAQVRKLNEDRNRGEGGEPAKAGTGVLVFNMYSGGTAVAAAKPANIEKAEPGKWHEGSVKDLPAAPPAPALSAATAPAAAAAPAPVAGPALGGTSAKGLAYKPAAMQEAAKAEKSKSELAYGGGGGGAGAAPAKSNEVLLVIRVQRNVAEAAEKAAEPAGKPAEAKP